MRVFRLIDVKTKAVVQLANVHIADFEYIALSYVWGSAQRLVMNLGNMDNLGEPGALNGTVSETIEDAMSLTAMLGIQYLWVDALCILQDDPLESPINSPSWIKCTDTPSSPLSQRLVWMPKQAYLD